MGDPLTNLFPPFIFFSKAILLCQYKTLKRLRVKTRKGLKRKKIREEKRRGQETDQMCLLFRFELSGKEGCRSSSFAKKREREGGKAKKGKGAFFV